MDIRAYLKQQKQQIGRQTRQVRRFDVFDFNHIPEEPIIRDECQQLIDAMLRFEATGVPGHQAVIGSRGSGKTLMVKYLQRLMPAQTDLDVYYANCRHHNTSYRILSHLLDQPSSGASLTALFDRFVEQSEKPAVIVLDEVDMMSPKDRRRELLYLLSRAERPYLVMMLSNSPHVLKQLDAATRSSLQPIPVHFRNYNAEQIRGILLDRARRGLHEWSDADLARIAALTVRRTDADARVAIKTLFYRVTRDGDDLESCFETARRDIVVDMVHDLTDANLTMLWAAIGSRSDLTRDIYRRYGELAVAQGDKPFSYVHFLSHLSFLQSAGLITLLSTKAGRTYTNRVLLNFDPDVVRSVVELRFGTNR